MGFGLVYAQSLHKPAILLRRKNARFAFFPRPLERSGLQTLIQQDKSITFPVQCFNSVPASAAEEEQCIGERIQIELLLDQRSQPIYSTTEVCVTAGNIHPVGTGEVCQHDFRNRSTVSTVAASAPE